MTETAPAHEERIVIMGAGFSGIGAAVRFLQDGEHDFVVLERADDIGGTWRDNVYPGCRCDVPSHLYSYSFAPNPEWRDTYADQAAIWRYLRDTAERFGVIPHLRFSHNVVEAVWDSREASWTVHTDRGPFRCRYLISATGALSEPSIPPIPGVDDFAGTTLHSARWKPHRFAGERVAVIGTGASAVQIVPSIQPDVEHLTVFQRTPGWVVPHTQRGTHRWERTLFGRLPSTQRLIRALIYFSREFLLVPAFTKYDGLRTALERHARRHLNRQVQDPELRAKLTPDYQLGCKRVLPSNDFYPALTQPNVDLVTDPIVRIVPEGVMTSDGELHRVDVIVFAAGFRVTSNPMGQLVAGRDGRRLAEAVHGDLPNYLGTTFPFFPNFFMLTGPNTGTGHTSQLFMIECQLNHIVDALDFLDGQDDGVIEVLESVAEDHTDEVQRRLRKTVWASGCASWYLNEQGRNVTMWPDYTLRFRHRTRRFDPADYVIGRHPSRRSAALGSPA